MMKPTIETLFMEDMSTIIELPNPIAFSQSTQADHTIRSSKIIGGDGGTISGVVVRENTVDVELLSEDDETAKTRAH